MKKMMVLSVALLWFTTSSLAACAQVAAAHPQCGVVDCNRVENHAHDGKMYAGHTMEDGHEYHQLCTVYTCTEVGSHDHDGVTHLPHNVADGHGYHGGTEHKSRNGASGFGHKSGGGKSSHNSGHH